MQRAPSLSFGGVSVNCLPVLLHLFCMLVLPGILPYFVKNRKKLTIPSLALPLVTANLREQFLKGTLPFFLGVPKHTFLKGILHKYSLP